MSTLASPVRFQRSPDLAPAPDAAPGRPRAFSKPFRTKPSLVVALAWALAIAVVFTALGDSVVHAESGTESADVGAEGGATEPTEAPIEAISVDQIGVASERTKRNAAETREALKASEAIADLGASIPDSRSEVEATLVRSSELRARDANLAEVDQLRQEWRVLLEQLEAMQAQLNERASAISRMRETLTRGQSIWKATAVSAQESSEGEEVLAQVELTLDEITAGLAEAKVRQGDVSALQGQVAGLSEMARGDLAELTERRRSLVGRVFERDRVPMTSPQFYALLEPDEIWLRLNEHWQREVESLRRFGVQHRDRLLLHLVATIAMVAFMFSARSKIERLCAAKAPDADDPGLEHMKAVFRGPISLALLLSLFVGLWGYDEIPPLASPVVGATALLPAVLILRRLVERSVFPVLYVLLALYFVDRLNLAIAPLPGLPRIVFVGEMLTVLVVVLWWRRPARLSDVSTQKLESFPFRWLRLGLLVALYAAPLAIIAELAGYTSLARMLGGSTLSAGYAGVMLYGSALALDGLVAFLLRVRPLRLLGMVQRHRGLVASYIQRWVRWLVLALFVWVMLSRLEIVETAIEVIRATWDLAIPLVSVDLTIGSIIEFVIIVRLTFALADFINFTLDEEVYTRARMSKGQPYAVSTLTHYLVLLVGFLLAVFALGLDTDRFTVLAGAFGVGIGFGLQTIVSNFVSGIILLTEQPVQAGDTIELEGVFGEVQRIGIRSTTVRTWQGAEVIVPNAQLISEQVTNWTLSDDRRRLEVPVGVAYGTDPSLVLHLLEDVARRQAHVLAEPSPGALFMNFGDSALEFELRCWTDLTGQYMSIRSALIVEIERALRSANVTIPFPQRDLHLSSLSPEVAASLGVDPSDATTATTDPAPRGARPPAGRLLPDKAIGDAVDDE